MQQFDTLCVKCLSFIFHYFKMSAFPFCFGGISSFFFVIFSVAESQLRYQYLDPSGPLLICLELSEYHLIVS